MYAKQNAPRPEARSRLPGFAFLIEIQISDLPEMRSRISYYLSNMITEQIGRGGHYSELKQVICIVITDYDFIPESEQCHTVFEMLEKKEHFPFNDLLEIDVLNLEKLPPEGEGKLLDWLRFLKAGGEEEIKMVAEKNPIINEAYCKLQEMSEDEATRMIYEARLKAQRDEYSRIQGALRTGREEGREEEREEVILRMAEHGMAVKDIAAIVHLSEPEVDGILGKDI
jgi:predicted transposase/invertase (TIGR01784 family)